MENNKFKRLCGYIDYNTYGNLQNILFTSSLGLSIASEFVPEYSSLYNPTEALSYVSLAAFIGLTYSNCKNYSKDLNQIRELYQEFIKNYNKLNKTFNLNDPVQINTMFSYLLYEGYLSKDKEFEFSSKQARDMANLGGANIITGKGVCRHISSMLTDIMNDYGIQSNQLGVCSMNYNIKIKILNEQKYTKEELHNWCRTHITDENTYSFIIKLIDAFIDKNKQNIELSYEIEDEKNSIKKIVGNHAISVAFKDGKTYFLDPTQSRIYRMIEDGNGVLYDDECDNIPIRTTGTFVLNEIKDFYTLKQSLSKPCQYISKEEEKEMVKNTLEICNGNMDIFEQFYNQNSELYNDISSKILKIKKRKFLK